MPAAFRKLILKNLHRYFAGMRQVLAHQPARNVLDLHDDYGVTHSDSILRWMSDSVKHAFPWVGISAAAGASVLSKFVQRSDKHGPTNPRRETLGPDQFIVEA